MTHAEKALLAHETWRGKLETKVRAEVNSKEDLALAYTPGVAAPCLAIQEDVNNSYKYTRRWNTVAIISDGTAVLGLGDIGPEASMPVMEGKAALFKAFGDVDCVPLCIRSKDVDEIVKTISLMAGSFGGINLEDIAAPRCFEIERKLKEVCDIPIFHDDQHGTAIVALAGIENALKLVGKKLSEVKVVFSGAGAGGVATAKLLMEAGLKHVIMVDKDGIITKDRDHVMAGITNPDNLSGGLADAIKGADVFMGLSAPGVLTQDMVKTMASDAIVFAMANPTPEIMPDLAKAAGARVVGTGRSDFPNQINNLLAFPGVFRGVFDAGAKDITTAMNIAASRAIAAMVSDSELSEDYVIPDATNPDVAKQVAAAVAQAWQEA